MFTELCNKTITIYNAYMVNESIKWYRKVLHNVFLNSNKQYIQSKTGATVDTNNLLVIPYQDGYIDPKEWVKLPNDKMKEYWTIGASQRDFYVVGECPYGIPPYTESQVRNMYESYTVKNVDVKPNFNSGIHRFVVMGV